MKEVRAKYEHYKLMHSKEYNLRKDKETKLEAAHNDLIKHTGGMDDIYTQIDSM